MVRKDIFGNVVVEQKLIERELLAKALSSCLRGLSLEEFARLLVTEFECIVEFSKLCKGGNAGQTISLLFNPHRLGTSSSPNGETIYSSLNKEGFLSGLARACLFKEHLLPGKNPLHKILQLNINGVQYVNEFPPAKAAKLCRTYALSSAQVKILDPCAGWGGRMIGAASMGAHYVAFEPAKKTYDGLLKLGEWLSMFETGFTFKVFNLPYEDSLRVKLPLFDFALTSPPYYDTERYSNEATNSCNRYKSFDEWVQGFYQPLIMLTMQRMQSNAYFILNIGDRRYPLSKEMLKAFPKAREIKSELSGSGGLRSPEGKERFFALRKV